MLFTDPRCNNALSMRSFFTIVVSSRVICHLHTSRSQQQDALIRTRLLRWKYKITKIHVATVIVTGIFLKIKVQNIPNTPFRSFNYIPWKYEFTSAA